MKALKKGSCAYVCPACGETFMDAPYRSRQARPPCCSIACSLRFNPRRKKVDEKRKCETCGKPFIARITQKRKAHLRWCSTSCAQKVLQRGERNSFYKHGLSQVAEGKRVYHKRSYDKHPEKWAAYRQKRRAAVRNAEGVHTGDDIKRIFAQQKERCVYCSAHFGKYHVDHIVPLARGGSNWPTNIQLLCPTCNSRKRDHMPNDFARKLGLLI